MLPLLQRVPAEVGPPVLRLTRASPTEVAAWEARQRAERLEAIRQAAGAGGDHLVLLWILAAPISSRDRWSRVGIGKAALGAGLLLFFLTALHPSPSTLHPLTLAPRLHPGL